MKTSPRKYKDPTRKDWIIGIVLLLVYVLVIGLSAFLLLPQYWYAWLLLVLGGIFALVQRQTKNYACRCRECGHEFEISFWANLSAPTGLTKKAAGNWFAAPIVASG